MCFVAGVGWSEATPAGTHGGHRSEGRAPAGSLGGRAGQRRLRPRSAAVVQIFAGAGQRSMKSSCACFCLHVNTTMLTWLFIGSKRIGY